MLALLVIEADFAGGMVVFEHSLFGLNLEIVGKAGASCAPGGTVIADGAAFKAHNHGTRTLL